MLVFFLSAELNIFPKSFVKQSVFVTTETRECVFVTTETREQGHFYLFFECLD